MTAKKKKPGPATAAPEQDGTTDGPQPEVQAASSFPIVGIGASAGGLAAFEAFFAGMPAEGDPGMAFVLVQHLAPDHKSILSDLVKRYTRMEVFEVTDGMEVKPNCTYIIPPNYDMAFIGGSLQLLEHTAARGMRMTIDFFFRSLAHDQHERAICIVLSGTGSDGSMGVRAVKGEGGMAMAQNPESTEFGGMPSSAIATGLIDYILPPAEMPARLIAYTAHAFGTKIRRTGTPTSSAEDILKKVCILLRDQTGHDFSQYKRNTLIRRVERRMAVHQIGRAEEYLRYLRQTPAEAQALFRDLLIGVTNFFRDPEAFAVLEKAVVPQLFVGKPAGTTVRVWVCGCASGEEAYSIAILLQEHLETLRQTFKVQVFATDLDPQAIEQARAGVYPASIAADVSAERLSRFFNLEEASGVYRIQKIIRDLLIFSEQDVIKDPPFSKIDMISCRNLLIYLNTELQKKLIPLFHYALNPGGALFLGTSESVGEFGSLFAVLDRKQKIYRRQTDLPGAVHPSLGRFIPVLSEPAGRVRGVPIEPGDVVRTNLREISEQSLIAHYARVAVLVNSRGEILHIYGRTGRYLEPASGDAGMNILTMAREGLRPALTAALYRAMTQQEPVLHPGLQVKTNGDYTTVNLILRPATGESGVIMPGMFLVIFEEPPLLSASPAAAGEGEVAPESARIAVLEQELRTKEEYLQSTLEEMETANEELKSTNEEMQSVNEELQSTNEELETSKEELQSVNEELATVNAELQNKVADLSRANNDMNNLLAGTGVATLFVDHNLHIVRFTPGTTELINLIQSDIGRPVAHIASNLVGYNHLVEDVQAVLRDLVPRATEVQTGAGTWFQMRIRPYRTLENVIEGAVITFVDITDRHRQKVDGPGAGESDAPNR
jgi:two-component system CheB/CheR fusion protein